MNYLICFVYLVFSIAGLTFMKLGSIHDRLTLFTVPVINMNVNFVSLCGYLCYICSFLIYTVVVAKFELGVVIPILSGIVNVVIFIVGITIFKEKFNIYSICGILLICSGIILMNISKK